MYSRSLKKYSTPSSTLGELHIFDSACLKHKWSVAICCLLVCMVCLTIHVYCQILAIRLLFCFVTKRTLSDISLLLKMFYKSPNKSFPTHWGGKSKGYKYLKVIKIEQSCLRQGCPIQGFKKSMYKRLFTKKNFQRGVHPARCRKQMTESGYCCCEFQYLVFVSMFTFFMVFKGFHKSIKMAKVHSYFVLFPELVPLF